ncbi:MAG: histidinol-phosphatase [Rikenellaceae bacterium]|nr:histidinol-phosphatase [Rikenellaceae bacterium]
MNLTNFHSHCDYCDGRAPMEEFIRKAIESGFTSYGISSHAPLPFRTKWNMDMENLGNYLADINRMRSRYRDRLEIYSGLEIDYYNEEVNPANEFFSDLELDYRIGSIHFVRECMETDSGAEVFRENLHKYYDGDLDCLCTDYFDASMKMVDSGGFDILGHCDKLAMNAEKYSPGYSQKENFKTKVRELLDLSAERGIMVEVNTKKYSAIRRFFPDAEYFRFMKDQGVRIVVNSDSHRPELINDGRKEALEILKRSGFRTVSELHGGEWIDVPIY